MSENIVIGITGGIGTGKSTVSDYVMNKGYPVIDADKVAREIVEPGSECLQRVADEFGNDIINIDGSLNRKLLASKAFGTVGGKARLDGIMMSEIKRIMIERITKFKLTSSIVFVDAALLFETRFNEYTDYNWLVDADTEIRIDRVIARDNATRQEVLDRINSQMSREDKIRIADVVLDNSGTLDALYSQIELAFKRIQSKKL